VWENKNEGKGGGGGGGGGGGAVVPNKKQTIILKFLWPLSVSQRAAQWSS